MSAPGRQSYSASEAEGERLEEIRRASPLSQGAAVAVGPRKSSSGGGKSQQSQGARGGAFLETWDKEGKERTEALLKTLAVTRRSLHARCTDSATAWLRAS